MTPDPVHHPARLDLRRLQFGAGRGGGRRHLHPNRPGPGWADPGKGPERRHQNLRWGNPGIFSHQAAGTNFALFGLKGLSLALPGDEVAKYLKNSCFSYQWQATSSRVHKSRKHYEADSISFRRPLPTGIESVGEARYAITLNVYHKLVNSNLTRSQFVNLEVLGGLCHASLFLLTCQCWFSRGSR